MGTESIQRICAIAVVAGFSVFWIASSSGQDSSITALSEDERIIGERFAALVSQDQSAKEYMERFSDRSFFSVTSKLRKLWGVATVIDGDTIRLAGETVHIAGIDAPEIPQTCKDKITDLQFDAGGYSLRRLKNYARPEKSVVCYIADERAHQGICFIWGYFGPMNIGKMLVREGAAWALPGPPESPYIRDEGWAEGVAGANKDPVEKNLWHSDCKPAWVWRKENHYEPPPN